MKKFVALILAAMMLFSLTACAQTNVEVEETAPVESEAAPAPAPAAGVMPQAPVEGTTEVQQQKQFNV